MSRKSDAPKTKKAVAEKYTPTQEGGRYVIMWALKSAPGVEEFLRGTKSDVVVRLIGKVLDGSTGQITITLPAQQALAIFYAPFELTEIEYEARRELPFTAEPVIMISASSQEGDKPNVTLVQRTS